MVHQYRACAAVSWPRGSRQTQLFGESGPIRRRDDALILQRGQRRKYLGPGSVDPAFPQLADHPSEPVLVLVRGQLPLLALAAELLELFGDARRCYGLESAFLLVSRHGTPLRMRER